MENPIKMDDLGVFPYFWKHPNQNIKFPSWFHTKICQACPICLKNLTKKAANALPLQESLQSLYQSNIAKWKKLGASHAFTELTIETYLGDLCDLYWFTD